VLSALFVPAMVLGTGLILPRRGNDAAAWEQTHDLVGWWPVRIVLFVVLALSLVHCAHRIRHVALDVGLRWLGPLLSLACYGAAAIGVGVSGYLLVTL
jgi:fumarate reductase subunit D